jgi:opacity protein-like surface antigen
MKRCACVAMLSVAGVLGAAVPRAHAQAAAGTDTKMSVEVTAGPTLGHKSSSFVAGEFDWRLTPKLDIFVEGGHMANVGTSLLDANANLIAGVIGDVGGGSGSVSSSGIKVNHFDAGIKFWIDPFDPRLHPYVIAGLGVASAKTEVNFALNGTVVDPAAYGVQLGGDLSGTQTKTIIVVGGGVTIPVRERYFIDLGYRFGGILSNTSDIENDTAIKTQRIILGFGARF